MAELRVLHVIGVMDQGGAENLLMNIYRRVDREKIQFDFCVAEEKEGFFDKEISEYGGNVYRLGSNKHILRYGYRLYQMIRHNPEIQVVHSHVYHFSGYVLLVSKLAGISNRIAHSHTTFSGKKRTVVRRLYEGFQRWLINKVATVKVACSIEAGQALFGINNGFEVVLNGIDLERFQPCKDMSCIHKQKVEFVHIGRFVREKNHEFLIKCFYEISRLYQDTGLTIVGEGGLLEEIKSNIRQYDLEDRVTILEPTKDIEKVLVDKDYLIFPSIFEGVGMVLIEAQAMGLTCFASDTIPEEAQVGLCEFLPLSRGEEYWASRIVSSMTHKDRVINKKLLDRYAIQNTVHELSKLYLGIG